MPFDLPITTYSFSIESETVSTTIYCPSESRPKELNTLLGEFSSIILAYDTLPKNDK